MQPMATINRCPTKDEFMVMQTKRWYGGDKEDAEEISVHEIIRPEHANFVYEYIREKIPNFSRIHDYSGISLHKSELDDKHLIYFARVRTHEHQEPIMLAIPIDCK